jgi:hypothetical protein
MKKTVLINLILIVFAFSFGFAQLAPEQSVTHTRGLLHQSVFNTGALGTKYSAFVSAYAGDSTQVGFEWPGNSYFRLNNHDYWYYNENGAGLVLCCDTGLTTNKNRGKFIFIDSVGSTTTKGVDMVGCLSASSGGQYRDGRGLHYWAGDVSKTTNFPLNSDGSWNVNYNPKEAEEIITSSVYTPYGLKITRTSRAWSCPGYDSFIIYDYEVKNTGEHFKWNTNAPTYIPSSHSRDTLSEIAVDWLYSFFPSYVYGNQITSGWTNEANKALSHIDLTRYLEYVVSPDGRPYLTDFVTNSQNGTYGGGLSAPASVGYMCLYYDYDKLQSAKYSRFNETVSSTTKDSLVVFDANNKFKQPWVWASTQANLSSTKILSHVEASGSRYAPWNPNNPTDANDAFLTTHMGATRAAYWYGRARPNANFNWASPMVHSMTYGPYQLPPDQSFHVVIAEVAGFGPGRKADAKYWDCGGGTETVVTSDFMHPVPSWDSVLVYATANPASISSTAGAGIAYTPTYGIPAYIRDTTVVSMRDVADRCIQLYSGSTKVVKWDTSQYEPSGNTQLANASPSPSAVAARTGGWNAGIKLPLPAPILTGIVTNTIISKITWQGTVESIPTNLQSYFNTGLDHYEILRSTSQLGPWTRLDVVSKKDSRYWNLTGSDNIYSFVDNTAKMGATYYYSVVSVDALGKKSGLSNVLKQQANLPYFPTLGKVYAVPNPFFLVSGLPGENPGTTYMQFFGLTQNSTIRVFSFSGQLIKTLHSDGALQSIKWDMRSESQKKIASGVYYFTVQDDVTGSKAWNKFVVIH